MFPQHEAKLPKIPAQVHFIWVGKSPLPKEYLNNIKKFTQYNCTINLWVDNKKNFIKKINSLSSDLLAISMQGIRLRNIKELFPLMQSDTFFLERNRYKYIVSNIEREMIGFQNLTSAADWLRYIILYFEGGYYFDVDIPFIMEKESTFMPDTTYFGFKSHAPIIADLNKDFLIDKIIVHGNNDIIASLPKHPILRYALQIALYNYKELDSKKLTLNQLDMLGFSKGNFYGMDSKRWPYSAVGNFSSHMFSTDCGRRFYTIASAGPNCLGAAINLYLSTMKDLILEEIESLQIKHNKIANLKFKPECYNTWLKSSAKTKYAFDDSHLCHPMRPFQSHEIKHSSGKKINFIEDKKNISIAIRSNKKIWNSKKLMEEKLLNKISNLTQRGNQPRKLEALQKVYHAFKF